MASEDPTTSTNSPSPQWLKLRDVLARLPTKEGEASAWAMLLIRLRTGQVRARAVTIEERFFDYDHLEERPYAHEADVETDANVSRLTWTKMSSYRLLNAASGTVEVRGSLDEDNRPLTILIHGMEVAQEDIVDLTGPPSVWPQAGGRGRPPGQFWPQLAEELAVFIHEEGVPDHHTPIGRIVDDVLDRLAKRGIMLSPTPVRKVVSAILARLQNHSGFKP